MAKKNICIAITVIVIIVNISISNAQQFIGIDGGIGKGTLLDFTNDSDYNAIYPLKNGITFSSFYENSTSSVNSLRIELDYTFQRADMKITNSNGYTTSFYKNLDYSFQLTSLNLIYNFRIIDKRMFKVFLLAGPTFSYTLKTKAIGNGWDFYYQSQTDTMGNPVQIITTRNWEKKENISKDISKFNLGLKVGMNFIVPLNERIDLTFQNKYNIFFSNFTTLKDLRYTSLLTGYLTFGLRYQLPDHKI